MRLLFYHGHIPIKVKLINISNEFKVCNFTINADNVLEHDYNVIIHSCNSWTFCQNTDHGFTWKQIFSLQMCVMQVFTTRWCF